MLPVAVTKISARFVASSMVTTSDLGHQHACTPIAERCRRALADVAVACDASDLAGEHHIGPAADRIDQALLTAVKVVELRFGHAVVDVDRRERELALLGEVVEAVDAGRGLFGHALDRLDSLREVARTLGEEALQRRDEDLFFLVRGSEQLLALFGAIAPQCEHRRIAAIVEDHVARGVGAPVEDALDILPVFLERLALDREHRNIARGNRGRRMILGREDVAARPTHLGA